ncbi:hypothetical protein J6590_026627 [Homalodisca vitripennis]|nr:hypothetical protein J6590_026627 [Homalodisca vitripennis]
MQGNEIMRLPPSPAKSTPVYVTVPGIQVWYEPCIRVDLFPRNGQYELIHVASPAKTPAARSASTDVSCYLAVWRL